MMRRSPLSLESLEGRVTPSTVHAAIVTHAPVVSPNIGAILITSTYSPPNSGGWGGGSNAFLGQGVTTPAIAVSLSGLDGSGGGSGAGGSTGGGGGVGLSGS